MQKKTYEAFQQSSYIAGNSSAYLDELYDQFLQDPNSVSEDWRSYFNSLPNVGNHTGQDQPVEMVNDRFVALAKAPVVAEATSGKQDAVDRLIGAFRLVGHHQATLDPLGLVKPDVEPRCQLSHYGLSDADLNDIFATRGVLAQPQASLKDIFAHLQKTYCASVGFEFEHVSNLDENKWLQQYIEQQFNAEPLSLERKKQLLGDLVASNGLEHYLGVKYPGVKRFSIEGVDALIPSLNALVQHAGKDSIKEVVLCMAHRGRLNVLVNTLAKPSGLLFDEFSGKHEMGLTTGDVKYHMGYSSDVKTTHNPVHVSMLFNPSHLDYIDPVLLGSVRGRQDRYHNGGTKPNYALGVMIHGDSAFSCQGVVAETLAMSHPPAYTIGGCIHIVTNNQIGYTTSSPADTRSSRYCTGVAKGIEAPIVHVNGDDAEAVIRCIDLAYAYRQTFNKDIVIDLVGYRRHGHQEVDEPRATQPVEYQVIRSHTVPADIYAKQLIAEASITEADYKTMQDSYRAKLDKGERTVEVVKEGIEDKHAALWKPFLDTSWQDAADTAISADEIKFLSQRLQDYPKHFKLLRQVDKLMQERAAMARGDQPMDWGFAETMAYASLVANDTPVRFSGEDSRRGTFFHRHATLFDQETGEQYTPLLHIKEDQAHFELYDSILAELGPLGFEYGYSTARPLTLVIWEAQFGDFANSAQVIMDQFISSARQKWSRLSGLTLLLPHGYEGMGPEHSSARLERYLQLCAQENIQVCVPTTPSQIFHLLRRQVLRPFRRPLIIMSPKSLLRHKMATSPLSDLSDGQFHNVIPEIEALDAQSVKRVVMCSGKVYYDLLKRRQEKQQTDVALIRIEQLYPFPYDALAAAIACYKNAKEFFWVQEEPRNQGAWFITQDRLRKCIGYDKPLYLSSRPAMAAPAAGYPALNNQQQVDLVELALDCDRLPEK